MDNIDKNILFDAARKLHIDAYYEKDSPDELWLQKDNQQIFLVRNDQFPTILCQWYNITHDKSSEVFIHRDDRNALWLSTKSLESIIT